MASPSPEPNYSRKPATTAPTTHRDDDGSTRMLNYPHRLSLGAAHLHLTAQLVLLIYLGSLQGDTVKPAERGPCRTVDPGRRRHDTSAFGMPAGRKLPAVTQKQELPTTSQTPKAHGIGPVPGGRAFTVAKATAFQVRRAVVVRLTQKHFETAAKNPRTLLEDGALS